MEKENETVNRPAPVKLSAVEQAEAHAAWREHLREAAAERGAQRAAAVRSARERGARGDVHAARKEWSDAARCYREAFCAMPYGADGDDDEDAIAHTAERARYGARRDDARSRADAAAAAAISRRRAPPRAPPPDVVAARAALGVGRGSSLREIEKAYRARARSAHPDKVGATKPQTFFVLLVRSPCDAQHHNTGRLRERVPRRHGRL